jgi:hypothetical protein
MIEVCSAGFMMTQLPATRGATVSPQRIASGKFHGATDDADPAGGPDLEVRPRRAPIG